MSRPSDWWVLDLGEDPTPGDPAAVRGMGRSWGLLADDAEFAEQRIRSLLGDGAVGAWVGEAGEAFREKTGDLPEQLGKCRASYRLASEALEWWAGRLATHQGEADEALVKGRVARRELEAAQAAASAAAASAVSAGNAGVLRPVVGGAEPPSAEAVSAARDRLRSARAVSASADAAVAGAQARLDQLRGLALDAKGLRESDGRAAAGRVEEASDAGIPERSRWERFKDWAAQAWDVIVTIAKVVVAVLGVVALIIGGPIAWVVFAAALIVLADTIMKYLQGRASLWDVAFAALSCIPGTRGLTTLAELKAAFAAGGLLGAGLHVAASARAAVVEMAAGIRALSSAAGSKVAQLANDVRSAYTTYFRPLAKGLHSMSRSEFGVMGTLRRLPEVLSVPAPQVGDDVYRVFGPAEDAAGFPMHHPTGGYPLGSGPNGQSWTPLDPHLATDFRAEAGLPDENPASFFVEATLVDPAAVDEIRLALPLDGNPGGWPEYIIKGADVTGGSGSVLPTAVGGVNEPWTTPPGGWRRPGGWS